jgi:hypothetical protein
VIEQWPLGGDEGIGEGDEVEGLGHGRLRRRLWGAKPPCGNADEMGVS